MLKSVSSRIVLTFSAIVIAGLLLFAVVTMTVFSKMSLNTDETIMSLTAQNVAESIRGYMRFDDGPLGNIVEEYRDSLYQSLSKYTADDVGIHVFDLNGHLLIASKEHSSENLAEEIRNEADNISLDATNSSDPGGLFTSIKFHSEDDARSNIYVLPIKIGDKPLEQTVGYVAVASYSQGIVVARTQLLSAIITTCIWLFLGTAFAIVIVGNRVTRPLQKIANAAKLYAEGDTSQRVEIEGNDEVATLAKSINIMVDTIEQNDKSKDTFLASVAHDLRTPMTTISGFADGILDGTIPPEKQHQYLSAISEETKRLSRLVSTLLTTSKMQNQKIHPSIFNVTDKAIQTLFTFENKIEEKNLNVEIGNDEPVYINADSDSIHQVLYNLMHNAVKFSPTGGTLAINITKDEAAQKAIISIRNDGIGIPEEEVPHVFEKFYKTDHSRGLDKSGMGLGLFIVKTVIDNHKEKITIDSGLNKGCEFSFTMPLAEKPERN